MIGQSWAGLSVPAKEWASRWWTHPDLWDLRPRNTQPVWGACDRHCLPPGDVGCCCCCGSCLWLLSSRKPDPGRGLHAAQALLPLIRTRGPKSKQNLKPGLERIKESRLASGLSRATARGLCEGPQFSPDLLSPPPLFDLFGLRSSRLFKQKEMVP